MKMPKRRLVLPLVFGVLFVVLFDSPFVYPFRLFVVFLHEISHGLAAVLTGLEPFHRELLGRVGIARERRAAGIEPLAGPLEDRLSMVLGRGSLDLQAAVHLCEVACGAAEVEPPHQRRPEQQDWIAEPLGSDQRVGRPDERLLQPVWYPERDRGLVEHPPGR